MIVSQLNRTNRGQRLYEITVEDVLSVAEDMDVPAEAITGPVLEAVRAALDRTFSGWYDAVRDELEVALGPAVAQPELELEERPGQ